MDEFDTMAAATPVETNTGVEVVENIEDVAPIEQEGNQSETGVEADENDENESEGNQPENEDDETEETKKKPDPKESQINRLKREKAELRQQLKEVQQVQQQEMLSRLEKLEKGLQGNNASASNANTDTKAPDINDVDKYPLGLLDDRYIEDRIAYGLEQAAAKQAEAALQRQQENEQQAALHQEQTALFGKVENLSSKGADLYDDFQESVVDSGMRGDWDLSQTTFEAAHDADNGAQILYELSQDPKEASRVAKLSPFEQLRYVAKRDGEISKPTANHKPAAGDPPKNTPRGANSRTQISMATDNLDDFEKLLRNTKSASY